MTTGFQTENICWVPEGEVFRLIDLYHWAEWRLDVDQWRVSLAAEAVPELTARAREGFELCRSRAAEDEEAMAEVESAEAFVQSLGRLIRPLPPNLTETPLPLGPLSAAWVLASDLPLESFYEEDYRPRPGKSQTVTAIPVNGALLLPACDNLDVPLMRQSEEGFALTTPTVDCVGEYPLPLDEPLPILDEFCGFRGNSNQGKMANLTLDGQIAAESPVCIPLHQLGPPQGYLTLYCQFTTEAKHLVCAPIRPSQVHRVEASLAEQGFAGTRTRGRNQIWRREEDWVHCLWNAPGLESEGVMVMPPFVVVAQAEGSRSPALREAVLSAILQTALGNIPEPHG